MTVKFEEWMKWIDTDADELELLEGSPDWVMEKFEEYKQMYKETMLDIKIE